MQVFFLQLHNTWHWPCFLCHSLFLFLLGRKQKFFLHLSVHTVGLLLSSFHLSIWFLANDVERENSLKVWLIWIGKSALLLVNNTILKTCYLKGKKIQRKLFILQNIPKVSTKLFSFILQINLLCCELDELFSSRSEPRRIGQP